MSLKTEPYSKRARRVQVLAQEAAEHLHHDQIGTEHLLLGLMREEDGVSGQVLRDLGLDFHRMEELVTQLSIAGQTIAGTQLELSADTKNVLDLAVDEARRLDHHYIGTEHLLLGLVRQQEGIALEVLHHLGISPDEVRRQTLKVLSII